MNEVVERASKKLEECGLCFGSKPILIGGMSMEYYGMRKAGADIDLIITDEDYQKLAAQYPDARKDIYGDMGAVIGEFEIWRSIALMDYDFFRKDAIDEGPLFVVSIDRLLWMRVCAMGVEKYRNDLELMKNYYYRSFTNPRYLEEMRLHEDAYAKANGTIYQGKYDG